jgi:hypothetical protein
VHALIAVDAPQVGPSVSENLKKKKLGHSHFKSAEPDGQARPSGTNGRGRWARRGTLGEPDLDMYLVSS